MAKFWERLVAMPDECKRIPRKILREIDALTAANTKSGGLIRVPLDAIQATSVIARRPVRAVIFGVMNDRGAAFVYGANEGDLGCPSCGFQGHIAYCDNGMDDACPHRSSPTDTFECPVCFATWTRYDAFGPDEWNELPVECQLCEEGVP